MAPMTASGTHHFKRSDLYHEEDQEESKTLFLWSSEISARFLTSLLEAEYCKFEGNRLDKMPLESLAIINKEQIAEYTSVIVAIHPADQLPGAAAGCLIETALDRYPDLQFLVCGDVDDTSIWGKFLSRLSPMPNVVIRYLPCSLQQEHRCFA